MSVATKNDDRGALYRWECDSCPKKGIWVRDREQAARGAQVHRLREHGVRRRTDEPTL